MKMKKKIEKVRGEGSGGCVQRMEVSENSIFFFGGGRVQGGVGLAGGGGRGQEVDLNREVKLL